MKKFKALLSVILAAAVLVCSAIPAFAVTEGETATADETSPTEMTDDQIQEARRKLKKVVDDSEFAYIYYYQTVPSMAVPHWSDASEARLKTAIEKARKELYTYKTKEEFDNAEASINKEIDELCVDKSNLEWMLNYMKKDYDSTGYYDDETYAKLKTLYENAQKIYETGTEKEIHIAYFNMRNMLDDLCTYNSVPGDVDNNGRFNICDITLMQFELAELVDDFNSSQNFIACIFHDSSISVVTDWQFALAEIPDKYSQSNDDFVNDKIETLNKNKGIDINIKYWHDTTKWIETEQFNYIYNYDRYVWWV